MLVVVQSISILKISYILILNLKISSLAKTITLRFTTLDSLFNIISDKVFFIIEERLAIYYQSIYLIVNQVVLLMFRLQVLLYCLFLALSYYRIVNSRLQKLFKKGLKRRERYSIRLIKLSKLQSIYQMLFSLYAKYLL